MKAGKLAQFENAEAFRALEARSLLETVVQRVSAGAFPARMAHGALLRSARGGLTRGCEFDAMFSR